MIYLLVRLERGWSSGAPSTVSTSSGGVSTAAAALHAKWRAACRIDCRCRRLCCSGPASPHPSAGRKGGCGAGWEQEHGCRCRPCAGDAGTCAADASAPACCRANIAAV